MSIPIALTLMRIVLSPLFLIVYVYYVELGITLRALPYILLTILSISELSDLFDGFVARKKNKVTELGKLLDPMADSIFRTSVLLAFTLGFIKLPLLLILVFIYRDSIISTLRTICALRGHALAARLTGKIKAIIQAIIGFLILLFMIPYTTGDLPLETLQSISFYSVLIGALFTALSAVEYCYANRHHILKALGF